MRQTRPRKRLCRDYERAYHPPFDCGTLHLRASLSTFDFIVIYWIYWIFFILHHITTLQNDRRDSYSGRPPFPCPSQWKYPARDMTDEQLSEFILHLSRSYPNAGDGANKELTAQFEGQIKNDENGEVSPDAKREIVKGLVGKVVELRGAMDGLKDAGE